MAAAEAAAEVVGAEAVVVVAEVAEEVVEAAARPTACS